MFRRRKAQSVIEYVVIFCVIFLALIVSVANRGFIHSVRDTLDNYSHRAKRAMVRPAPLLP